MDDSSTLKLSPDISNVTDIKLKLTKIVETGKDEYNTCQCLKLLLTNNDQDVVLLSLKAISELAKCEEKRETYANREIIEPILEIFKQGLSKDKFEMFKQCCRALGNLCCDCDTSRITIIDCEGVPVLLRVLTESIELSMDEIRILMSKMLLNFAIGGQKFTDAIVQGGLTHILSKILNSELEKEDIDDDTISTSLLILNVINDNTPECLYDDDVNLAILNVLKDTSNIDISELCLDHLYAQAEHDSVKTLLAKNGGIQLVCSRLEQLIHKQEAGELNVEDNEVEAIIRQACDLVIIILTGDEAMHILYSNGVGEVYLTMIKWLESSNYNLLTTAILAIGNFARQDDYCIQMMENHIYDKLLDLFEIYHGFAVRMHKEPENKYPIESTTVTKIQHAILSAIRNLTVAVENKRVAAAKGRAAPLLLDALLHVEDHHVAYKLLAAIRMLVDGQEGVAKQLANNKDALARVARWGSAGEGAGAAGEAPRLIAWAVKQLRHSTHWQYIIQVEGCITSLVNMLVTSHSLMQNEAILALTLLAIESINKTPTTENSDYDYEKSFITQLIESEIGKHVSILVDTNCAKMPVEVAENLMAFLDITSKKNKIAFDYKEAKVQDSLKKFSEARSDLGDDLKSCIGGVIAAISDNVNIFGVETLGPWGPDAHTLYRDVAKRLVDVSRDRRAGVYLGQRISIAIQRGNAASLLGTFPIPDRCLEPEF